MLTTAMNARVGRTVLRGNSYISYLLRSQWSRRVPAFLAEPGGFALNFCKIGTETSEVLERCGMGAKEPLMSACSNSGPSTAPSGVNGGLAGLFDQTNVC